MTCAIPICQYIKFDIAKAKLQLVAGGQVKSEARLKQMPNYQQYEQEFNRIRGMLATTQVHQQCEQKCHCTRPENRPVARNVPVTPWAIADGTLPNNTTWAVEITGVTYTIWIGICLPSGAKVRVGDTWRPAESWGPGWETPPVDDGKPLGSGGGKKKKGKKGKKGGKGRKVRRVARRR